MDMINIVAIAPAELLPPPPDRRDGRPPPPRTASYLLLPRAGAIMVDPPPVTACLTQAGPFQSSARLEIRRDGYFMEELRTLARSARGSAAPFAHPRLVPLEEYTTSSAATATALARTSWAQEEPASIHQPMPGQGPQSARSSNTNAWNCQTNNQTPTANSYPISGSAQQPINLSGTQHSPLSSSSTDASATTQTPATSRTAPSRQRGTSNTPQAPQPNANPGAHWFGVYEDDSNEDENDDQPAMDTTSTTEQADSGVTPTIVPPRTPTPQASAAELIQAAVEEARRVAQEESQKAIAAISARYEQENQVLRQDLLQQQATFRQKLMEHTDATTQARTDELQRSLEARDRARDAKIQQREQHQEQERAEEKLARQREQAQQNDRQAKSDALMETLMTFLAQAQVSSGPRLMAASSTNPTTPTQQTQSNRSNHHDHQWYTNPALLPEHWIRQQQEYREHALAIMLSCDPPPIVNTFLQEFLHIRHREP